MLAREDEYMLAKRWREHGDRDAAEKLVTSHLRLVDGDMDELPAEPFAAGTPVALSPAITGDAMTDAIDFAELLNIEMDHLARMLTLVATHRLGGLERLELI